MVGMFETLSWCCILYDYIIASLSVFPGVGAINITKSLEKRQLAVQLISLSLCDFNNTQR